MQTNIIIINFDYPLILTTYALRPTPIMSLAKSPLPACYPEGQENFYHFSGRIGMWAGHCHPDSCFISSYIIVPPETFKPLVISPLLPCHSTGSYPAHIYNTSQKVRDDSTCLKCVAPCRVFVFLLTHRESTFSRCCFTALMKAQRPISQLGDIASHLKMAAIRSQRVPALSFLPHIKLKAFFFLHLIGLLGLSQSTISCIQFFLYIFNCLIFIAQNSLNHQPNILHSDVNMISACDLHCKSMFTSYS